MINGGWAFLEWKIRRRIVTAVIVVFTMPLPSLKTSSKLHRPQFTHLQIDSYLSGL
jgi:hypothetical protein